MWGRERTWAYLLVLLALFFLLASFSCFRFLWVFPLDANGLPLWLLLCGADIVLARTDFSSRERARLLLWIGGLFFFTARQEVPLVGLLLVFCSALLWALERARAAYVPIFLALVSFIFVFGHNPAVLHPGMGSRLGELRFSCHLLASFALFRMISWVVAVRKRGARPDFLVTMEYFLSPAFWLSPLHAAHLSFDHFEDRRKPVEPAIAMGWIVRGFLHAALFTLLLQLLLFVQGRFSAGLSSFHWWEIVLLGPFLFLISYLEKSRVTYLVAGHLSLVGYRLEPDFRSPWLARDLLEYWRRFHYWMWEYYVDFVYLPLSTYLARTFGPREASLLALFLTFTVGTSIVHWVHYPAPFVTALVLGLLFGLASLFHGIFSKALQRSRWGTAFTWLTVFFLYILAYPAYGLGWGVHDFFEFLRR